MIHEESLTGEGTVAEKPPDAIGVIELELVLVNAPVDDEVKPTV